MIWGSRTKSSTLYGWWWTKTRAFKVEERPNRDLQQFEERKKQYVEANKHDKQQTMVLEATMSQGHDTLSNGQTQVPSIIYDEINLGVMT